MWARALNQRKRHFWIWNTDEGEWLSLCKGILFKRGETVFFNQQSAPKCPTCLKRKEGKGATL